ncbi:hypothetical protein ColLi_10675 [Colletotrichum liriopes]|uniref:Uncharacterized protein n=1 Tax=Colletotrichum liriopes TaxID=708192 RepID=A0AA37LX50_9PEZI|nr:hypothetical protein ColLi_10675 [Colletotrichum liriopes]
MAPLAEDLTVDHVALVKSCAKLLSKWRNAWNEERMAREQGQTEWRIAGQGSPWWTESCWQGVY